MNWPYLWKNDTWTISSQLISPHKASRRSWWDKRPRDFLRNQQVEGWDVKNEWLYKGIATRKMGHVVKEGRKKKERIHCTQINSINIRTSHPRTWPRTVTPINLRTISCWHGYYLLRHITNLLGSFLVKLTL